LGGADLVVVNTSAAYFLGGDENANAEIGKHVRTMRALSTLPTALTTCLPKPRNSSWALRPDEVETLGDGIRLINSIRTVGNFVKWLIVGILGLALGTVMFGESVAKILAWFRG
jgi:hypothetical protein